MNDPLSPDDRALLDAGASGDLPGDGDRDRVRRKLAARLGAAAGLGTAAVATKTASAATASAGVSLGAKLVAVLAVVGAVSGGAAYVATRHAPPASNPGAPAAPPSTPVLANTANANANPSPIASAEPAPVAAPPPVATTTAPALAPAKAPAPPPHASGGIVRDVDFGAAASSATTGVDVSGAAAPTSAGGPRDALAEETRLIRSAHAFVAAGDGARALVVLDEHARRFPAGVLTEEREAERVLALCAAGRTADAKRAGSTFLAARPRSALAPRVRGSCGGTD